MALQVHLPDQQVQYFQTGQEQQAAAVAPRTHLTAWLQYNHEHAIDDPDCRTILYADFPRQYTYLAGTKMWRRRVRQLRTETIGRIVSLSPQHGEVYYLRVLLCHVPGATCYADLRTVDGVVHETFQEACIARGLLQDDREWEAAMQDATGVQMPAQIRQLFVTLLTFCAPAAPLRLYQRHQAAMAEDITHRHPYLHPEEVTALALLDIERRLQRAGKELASFHLPAVSDEHRRLAAELELAAEVRQLPILLQEELAYDVQQLQGAAAERLATLLPSQRQMYGTVMQAVQEQRPLAVFVDAPGGTGKTYTFNTILAAVRSERRIALAVAFSGIAATLLDGGRTFHSRFRAPLAVDVNSTLAISAQSPQADLLRRTELIICDEAPMAHRFLLEALDRSLRDITQREQPFGGKVIVLGGDFRQTLPVVPRGSRAQIVDSCIRRSPLWRHFAMLRLDENMRARQAAGQHQDEVAAFANWLVQLGSGQLPELEEGVIQLPEELIMPCDLAGVVHWVFGDMALRHHDGAYMSSRAVLAPTNKSIDHINEYATGLFPGEAITCLSADSTVDDAQLLNIPVE